MAGSVDRSWWSRLYAGEVDRAVRARGRQYFESGAVTLEETGPSGVFATVSGSRLYAVEIESRRDHLRVKCTCPHYVGEMQWCKHIWATILAAEADALESGPPRSRPRPGAPPDWAERISALAAAERPDPATAWLPENEILYVVDAPATLAGGGLVVEVLQRQKKENAEWSKMKPARIRQEAIPHLPEEGDRTILSLLLGARPELGWYPTYYGVDARGTIASRFALSGALSRTLLPLICATGRCRLRRSPEEPSCLSWSDGPPWEFWLEVRLDGQEYLVAGRLRQEAQRRDLDSPILLTGDGLVFWPGQAALLDDGGAFSWIGALRKGSLRVPRQEGRKLAARLAEFPRRLRIDMPEEIAIPTVAGQPRPRARIVSHPRGFGRDRLRCELLFDYSAATVPRYEPGWAVYDEKEGRIIERDPAAEHAAYRKLREAGVKLIRGYDPNVPPSLELAPSRLPGAVRSLLAEGWQVEAEGKLHRQASDWRVQVRSSSIDWFDLEGAVSFGGEEVPFPAVLAALRRGENLVPLGDGDFGVLPEEWLRRYGVLAALTTAQGGAARFHRSQTSFLDAVLGEDSRVSTDEVFRQTREKLRGFQGVRAADASSDFRGELRPYQREGLGWLFFLEEFGFGGCLADDMGLGKTVQVLAFLQARANRDGRIPKPSLVVVPRSVLFNWKEEAARFTPRLAISDHSGPERPRDAERFPRDGVVLTTYGTMRRDAALLASLDFDCVVLDEAQAIKNAASESAKTAKRLKAAHRLALSGTPIENRLGELWSLLEFLNSGMLGRSKILQRAAESVSADHRTVLARGLRPFLLRRTKAQVARDLPARTEQTILCDLEAAQRKIYDELKNHYRRSLLDRVKREGIGRSKIHVLEALLRLRQAACHPGLIDPARRTEPCAKLDALLPQLSEVLAEGHKALVFSQFTSFLAILRPRLQESGIAYEYLDGKTKDRAKRVRRFQEDPACGLFLISLKAGGLGLNLTAAEYVFLLDPWWNPAVEAQAVDRAHRIGQERAVFAYRLIARDTVEEKVLALQREKRALADAILGADKSLIGELRAEDLEMLFS